MYWALRRAQLGGTPQWKVPTDRARRRIAELRAAGWSMERIARSAGIASPTVWRILRERRCYNTTSDAVCALEP
jgi:hypothetical protein